MDGCSHFKMIFFFLKVPKWDSQVEMGGRSGFRLPQSSFPPRHRGYSANQLRYRFAHLPFSPFLQPLNCFQQSPFSFCSASFPFNNPNAFILNYTSGRHTPHICHCLYVEIVAKTCGKTCLGVISSLHMITIIINWVIDGLILRCVVLLPARVVAFKRAFCLLVYLV